MTWFFVCSTGPEAFEVQLLNEVGQAAAFTRFLHGANLVMIGEYRVPAEVLRAAERTTVTGGQYVDEKGRLLDFYGNLLETSMTDQI